MIHAAYTPNLTVVVDTAGNPWYTTSNPENDWAVFFVAPAQAGWQYIYALAVVNGDTGKIESYQVRCLNVRETAVPGT